MASNLLGFPSNLTAHSPLLPTNPFLKPSFTPNPILKQSKTSTQLQKSLSVTTLSSQQLPFTLPSTREEAISQAKLCLSTTLQKPFNNHSIPLPTRKLKKPRQPRFRVEIPVVDDSPGSLSTLAADIFSDLNISKKGSRPKVLILWPSAEQLESARKAFDSADSAVNSALGALTPDSQSTATDLAVILAPRKTDVSEIQTVAELLYPRPVVLFNPQWGFDEEREFDEGTERFVGSFEVVYSFMGLEVRGLVSKRRGAVLRCVRDGVVSGEGWVVMVDYENNGEMKVVTKFKRRPMMAEVESVLYNVMASNSPVTKSVKFLSDLVSNVTGKKEKK